MKANILKRVIASALLLTVTASFAACGKTEGTTATTAAAGILSIGVSGTSIISG